MKIVSLKKIENTSLQYDIQTESQNFFANGVLVHNSMVTPVLVSTAPGFKFKTKKSFSTKEAAMADELVAQKPEMVEWVISILKQGMTPTFEITSPLFPIVLRYETSDLTLLHVRENVSGRYLSEAEILELGSPFPLVENLIDLYRVEEGGQKVVSWSKLKAAAETATGIEGWVIQFDSGEMVKLKTLWYTKLHHAVTFTRWRDIARAVADDSADDLKAAFSLTGRSIEPILEVERSIKFALQSAESAVWMHVENGKALGRTDKDMALALREHPLFGLIMQAWRGKQPDFMAWYAKHHLENDFSLEVVAVNL